MVNIVGFLQGVRESNDYWTKKAAEARDEYNRFVQSNPDSTVDDRIERQKLLGGEMDYLRRLMPNKDNVTRNVGVQTQLRTDQQDQRDRLAASAGYAANRNKEAEARFAEWEAGADDRAALSKAQLTNADLQTQERMFKVGNMKGNQDALENQRKLAAKGSTLSNIGAGKKLQNDARNTFFANSYGMEDAPPYKEFLDYMKGQDTQQSFGTIMNETAYNNAIENYNQTKEINSSILSQQLAAQEIQVAKAYQGQIVNLLEAGTDVNANSTNDVVIDALSAKSEPFKELGSLAQNSVVDNAKIQHNSKVNQRLRTALNDWATSFNADPAKWEGPEGLGSQFPTESLSPENNNLMISQVKILSNDRRTTETDSAKKQLVAQVLKATNEDQIASAKGAIQDQFPLLDPNKIKEVMGHIKEIEDNKVVEFEQKRKQAVGLLETNFERAISENQFANLADLQRAIASDIGSVSHLKIDPQDITKLEDDLTSRYETTLSMNAEKANQEEESSALTAMLKDTTDVEESSQSVENAVKSVEAVGAMVSAGFGLPDDDKTILGKNLASAYSRMSSLARELGIPMNKEFVEATLLHISNGSHSDSLSIVSADGVLEQTLLDAMEANLSETYKVSPSMRTYMSSLNSTVYNLAGMDVPLSGMSQAQRIKVGQEWSRAGGGKNKYYQDAFDVIPDATSGSVGHPKHGGKRNAGLVTTIEQIEKDAQVDINLTTQNISQIAKVVNGLQSDASGWKSIYTGQQALQPFSQNEKEEFTISRSNITNTVKRNAAAVRDLLIQAVEDKDKLTSQMRSGSFYQSQISGDNAAVQTKMLAHVQTLDQSIQQYQQLLTSLNGVNNDLISTEMDLEPRGVNEIRAKYPVENDETYTPSQTEEEQAETRYFNEMVAEISANTDALFEGNRPSMDSVFKDLSKNRQYYTKDTIYGIPSQRLMEIYDDAEQVALSRRDFLELQADDFQRATP